jgi:hypothetical protein
MAKSGKVGWRLIGRTSGGFKISLLLLQSSILMKTNMAL